MASEITDRVEREIVINAPINRVWGLVSEPGWWIGDGDRSTQEISREGDVFVVNCPPYGRFPVLPISADAPAYAAFRCAGPGEEPVEGTSTLVEFFLTEQADGTLLRVVESGFAALTIPDDERRSQIEDNIEGWGMQLGFAKRDAERVAA